ncbi:MAG: DUF2207 domain-containing protein, partial [Alphaproteobacteria bacterium]|nr:DUF2207 domain-containing protein [Alphaproteobacteria bacterium]
VEERIEVVSAGAEIKRGIFRDFPTQYRGPLGIVERRGFALDRVTRDGKAEPYHTEPTTDGVRVYIGDADVFLEPGPYVYRLAYRTDRQLGHFGDFDELYWNVTGNGWAFVIEHAAVRIHLPAGATVLESAGYTGRSGETGVDYSVIDQATGSIWFETTRTLAPKEGLTVAVSWPAGFVARPVASQQVKYLLRDNAALVAALVGLLLLLVYYLSVWARVGRDPQGGPITAVYAPPTGISPAASRYLARMGYDQKAFTAAILSMAVKGFLTISEGRKYHRLIKTGAKPALSRGEHAVAAALFKGGRDELVLSRRNRARIVKALKGLKKALRTEFEKTYFVTNRKYFYVGIAVTALMVPFFAVATPQVAIAGFMVVWLSGWSVGVYFLIRKAVCGWQEVASGQGDAVDLISAIFTTIFAAPFVGAELVVLGLIASIISVPAAVALGGIFAANFIFYHLLKAPTRLGRDALDRIEGFKLYLSVAEKDRMEFHNPPDATPELFERYLPYALALDVDHEWSERFASLLAAATQSQGGSTYSPGWYSGSAFHGGDLSGFTRSLSGSLASAVASSSASSSGSSGGGSSGGGGGGGGGGGW